MANPAFPERLVRGVRRIVTGIDDRGKAVVVSDGPVTGDERSLALWGADRPPVLGDASPPLAPDFWPPPGGVRISLSSRKPDRIDPDTPPPPKGWTDINDAAGFHASDTSDIVIMISGRIWLELDDGVEVELQAGDVLVQNGTRHSWRNHGDEWPVMAVVKIGAQSAV